MDAPGGGASLIWSSAISKLNHANRKDALKIVQHRRHSLRIERHLEYVRPACERMTNQQHLLHLSLMDDKQPGETMNVQRHPVKCND